MLALADLALKQPELANAIRVAADILRWQAAVRNPRAYAEQRPREPAAITVVLGIERPRVEQEAIPPALPDGDPSR
ncbi:MAG: hypothetical protein RML56_07790 [Burkholderiales bacterium]|nr:hypothetical protein [Burkholderiales bacterium]